MTSLARWLVAEGVGTAFLVAAVVGSGIMGERLAGGNVAVALLANTVATGAMLVALILAFGGISSQFNPVVTASLAAFGKMSWRVMPVYVMAQVGGAVVGVVVAHAMFGLPLVAWSQHARCGFPQVFSEFVATFGLMAVIHGCGRHRPAAVPYAVAGFVTAGYWFTASTAFANPAVAIARCMTDTFSGIRPTDVPAFIGAQIAGAVAAGLLFRWLLGPVTMPAVVGTESIPSMARAS